MNALFSKTAPKKRMLLVDVGDMSIGASLVDISSDDLPFVIFETRKRIPIPQQKDRRTLNTASTQVLEDVLQEIHRTYRELKSGPVEEVHVFFGAAWCLPSLTIENSDFVTPQKMTNKLLQDTLAAHAKKQRKAHPGTLIIETEPLDVRCDGYKMQDHYTKEVKNFGVDILDTHIPQETVENVERSIGKYFAVENMHPHSSTLTLYTVLRGVFSGGKRYLIIDIGGDMTEILLVDNDTLVEIGSIPVGAYDLARTVSEVYKTTPEEALSRLNIHREGRAEKRDTRMNVTLLKAEDRWKDGVVRIIKEFEYAPRVPEYAFYITTPRMQPLFEDILQKSDLFKFGDLAFLGNEILKPFVEYKTPRFRDSLLALEAVYTHMYTTGS